MVVIGFVLDFDSQSVPVGAPSEWLQCTLVSFFFFFFFLMPSHFMGNRRGNRGKSVRLYFWGSKITADGDCSQEMKRLLGRKVMTNLDSILKSRDITLPIKVHLVKAMVFPVVMYGCKSWTVKKSEH